MDLFYLNDQLLTEPAFHNWILNLAANLKRSPFVYGEHEEGRIEVESIDIEPGEHSTPRLTHISSDWHGQNPGDSLYRRNWPSLETQSKHAQVTPQAPL